MGNVYIFRGKAATGKSTLANKLGEQLGIPVFCKDDIMDAVKSAGEIEDRALRNRICYNTLVNVVQRSLDLKADIILDIALGERKSAKFFFDRLDFGDNIVMRFFLDCADEEVWLARHAERLKNPLPHQSFKSLEHVVEHYEKKDVNSFEDEIVIDSSNSVDETFEVLVGLIS